MIRYHDREWGVPVHDDRRLFEFLILESAQAGLSWSTILNKRPAYRKAFARFDPRKVARFTERTLRRLVRDDGIVRNRAKIAAAVANARAFLAVQRECGSFDAYIWRFRSAADMSRDLRRRGFRFVGPTICHAFMQAIGMVNDHEPGCFRRR
jgi:DNA-3-methyladenine glycosylase I